MIRLPIALALLLAGLILTADRLTPLAAAATAPPLYGPGGVLAMHQRFFTALDGGDVGTIGSILTGSPRGLTWSSDDKEDKRAEGDERGGWGEPRGFQAFLYDHKDQPRNCDKESRAVKWLSVWSQNTVEPGGRWKTRITDAWMDCPSGDLGYAVLELERTYTTEDRIEVRRYRSTSLVSYTPGGWKLWHLHVSPAG